MGNQQIRTPQQQRSIDKRNKIIEAGFQLFCEKGYYNTNTAEIAKLAGVSTGIVYSYFQDKKDIFLYVIEYYENGIIDPIYELIKAAVTPIDLESLIRQILTKLIESHNMVKSVHEEMRALSLTDNDISEVFYKFESNIAHQLVEFMEIVNIHPSNAFEKTHLIIDIIQNLIHETVYRPHEYLDYEIMTDVAINAMVDMLKK